MGEYQFNQFNFTTDRGSWPKSTMTLKMTKSESGAEISKCRHSGTPGRLVGLGQRASRSGDGGVKKNTSRSGQERHLEVGSKSVSGSLRQSKSSLGYSPLGSGRELDSGGLGHPGRAWEKSLGRWGVQPQVQELDSHLGEKL